MMKGWPNFDDRCWTASRAIMSVLPPAPNGTTTVTGRVGQSAARTGPVGNARVATIRNARGSRKAPVMLASRFRYVLAARNSLFNDFVWLLILPYQLSSARALC